MKTLLERAILRLHPTAKPFIDYLLKDEGSGPEIAAWHLSGQPPSEDQIATLAAEYDTAEELQRQERHATRQRILILLQSATGKSLIPGDPNAVTAAERTALSIAQQYMLGMVTAAGNVKDPTTWLRHPDD